MTISRRDFLNGTSLAIIAGMTPLDLLGADMLPFDNYPPSLTGLRGSHAGSYESAHALAQERMKFPVDDLPVEEKYDLVIVGAGISGLSAAFFYQKKFKNAKILLLDNHDDFGGHAKRNEFKKNKTFSMGYGGSESLQSPKHLYSNTALKLLEELKIDIDKLEKHFDVSFYPKLHLSRGVFFDKENFLSDKFVSGDPTRSACDEIPPGQLHGKKIKEFINEFPMSSTDKNALIKLYTEKKDYLPKLKTEEKVAYLQKISYRDFLLKHVGISEQAVKYFQAKSHDFDTIGIDAISAYDDSRVLNLPGLDGMNLPPMDDDDLNALNDPYIYHFPDGNATIARLLVSNLMPKVTNGIKDMNSIILNKFDYTKLDLNDSLVRLRLSSTVVTVANANKGKEVPVDIGYLDKPELDSEGKLVKLGTLHRIQAKHVIMANYNMMIPYILTELPQEQKEALALNVKAPLLYTKVLISNWKSFIKLGVHEIYSPCLPYCRVKLDYPVDLGRYFHPRSPEKPIQLHMVSVPSLPEQIGKDARTQFRMGRYKLLTTSFSEFEKDIRNQLQRILAPTKLFNHEKDILGITINRWSHGYSYYLNSLFDDEDKSNNIINTARKPFGNVVIANSDADWNPYAQTAIDQAHRAVDELFSQL
ncbi:NAD(P)/FAD-dependent oxidoreductase [Silvanigrella aquatica]|uniref:Spermidine dehydrogenase n=1 Tax=Silvanigrella aquatica TaxID=1915309 RepID=A0A1L4D1N2_9BACT|nr:FAD/NAD(P)-binding protein [Silvanigrella aquatica]APJ04101.1 spermidine dehydrogenase [Silvanigrella aquatica]